LGLASAVIVQASGVAPGALENETSLAVVPGGQTLSASTTLTFTKGDEVWVDVDGDLKVDPGDTIRYEITIENAGPATATGVTFSDTIPVYTVLSGTIKVSPLAFDDVYTTVGNTLLEVGTPSSPSGAPKIASSSPITANDKAFNGTNALVNDDSLFSIVDMDTTSAQGGTVIDEGGGAFSYLPPAGFSGADAFTYTIKNAADELTGTGRVDIVVGTRVFYVKNDVAGPGTGRSADPFNTLSAAESAANQTGDIIYVHYGDGTTTNQYAGITLLNGQQLTGEGVDLVVDGMTLYSAGTAPTIGNGVGDGVTLAQSNTVRGLTVGNASGYAIADGGGTVGGLTINQVTINNNIGGGVNIANGGALDVTLDSLVSFGGISGINLNAVSGTATFTTVAIEGSSGAGIAITNNSGTVNVNGGTIGMGDDPAGNAVDIDGTGGGTGSINIAASVRKTTSGRVVEVTNRTGGAVIISGNLACDTSCTGLNVASNSAGSTTFSGGIKMIYTGANNAVTLSGNTGHTINFNGGGLSIYTTSGTGFSATGGAAGINVTGSGNAIDSTTGVALNVANTTIGGSGLTFHSISAGTSSGSTGTGIILDNTGSSGGLTVTGDGATAGSGGTIRNKTGANGSSNGVGIWLNQTRDVSLSYVQLNDFDNFAIRGTSVTNFVLANSVINGANGTSAAADEGSVSFDNLLGSATFSNDSISGGAEDNIVVTNSTGTLDRMMVTGTTIGANHAITGNDGILVEAQGAAVLRITVDNSTFTSARGDLFQANGLGTSTVDVVFTNNTLSNNHPNIVSGGGGTTFSGGSATAVINYTYVISGNTFRDALGNAITANFINGSGTVNGTIENNTIGVAGVSASGSSQGAGISVGAAQNVVHTVTIRNNVVTEVQGSTGGIDIVANTDVSFNATIVGNSVTVNGSFPFTALYTILGGGTGVEIGTACLDIRNNTFDASSVAFAGNAVFLDQISSLANYNLPGYAGSPNGEFMGGTASANIHTYLAGRGNVMVNGPFPGFPGGGVDAGLVVGVTGVGSGCP
jgi:uncharacterized repeat protein (TIGR01451 family)